jgi:hypothetical protein
MIRDGCCLRLAMEIYPRGVYCRMPPDVWGVQSEGGDEIQGGILCLLLCVFFLATSPIWFAILLFSRNYKDLNQEPSYQFRMS